ncbi:hypothetical protein Hanom_Chr11g00980061 [Helianthus anomalus]
MLLLRYALISSDLTYSKMVLLHGIKVVRDSVGPDTDRQTNVYPILISRLLFCFILIGHECKKQYIFCRFNKYSFCCFCF